MFEDKREIELLWNCKNHKICNVVLPFQTIEQIDEPMSERGETGSLFAIDNLARQKDGWSNKLIC
jgi:hypothetical protein